ncbi:MAG: hypothetical protein HY903_14915 [Deltaproteobacteria bacterium]|nr:hypothetical protein [Deltaproteobacteria bacterium]
MRPHPVLAVIALCLALPLSCQDYAFEPRPAKRVQAKKITELVATVVPTDILFVIDNSGSMQDEITELQNNVDLFIQELAKSDNDFQAAIITPDVECNVPGYRCVNDCNSYGTDTACDAQAGCGWSGSACTLTGRLGSYACCSPSAPTPCQDQIAATGEVIGSSCDGGRLRASAAGTRIFRRPAAGTETAWVAEFKETIAGLGTSGSAYEGGLEAVRRAVLCSADVRCDPADLTKPCCDAADQAVTDLNRDFVRPDADLVVIFVSDEDDCSMEDRNAYARPALAGDAAEQGLHLCWPNECYAYFGAGLDTNVPAGTTGLMDWADPGTTAANQGLLQCGPRSSPVPRVVNPPLPRPVDAFLDALQAAKAGDVSRVRAAGIVTSVPSAAGALGSEALACVGTTLGPSNDCGCLSTAVGDQFFCKLTAQLGQRTSVWPDPPTGGCTAMAGGRYVEFLRKLALRRRAVLAPTDTLLDSICNSDYAETMYTIVNSIILNNCFDLGQVASNASDIIVTLRGQTLANVPLKSEEPGWSLQPGTSRICLEGGLRKAIGDEFEILLITSTST